MDGSGVTVVNDKRIQLVKITSATFPEWKLRKTNFSDHHPAHLFGRETMCFYGKVFLQ